MRANLIYSTQSGKNMGIESRFTEKQIKEFRRFEDAEIDRFLKEYFPNKETKIWLPEIIKKQFPLVRAETKAGIKAGIDDFLKIEGMEGLSLYLADLTAFVRSKNVGLKVKENLEKFRFNDLDDYCNYIDESYRGFIYQISADEFKRVFNF